MKLLIFCLVGLPGVMTSVPLCASGLQTSPVAAAGRGSLANSPGIQFIRECLEGNRIEEALKAADRFARAQSRNPEALLELAALLATHSQPEAAAPLFARVNNLRPHSPNVLYNLGIAYYQLKRLDEAAQALAESADLEGGPAETHFALSIVAAERGDHENAILELRHALRRTPGRADYYALLGQQLSKTRYWQDAADAYRHAISLVPGEPAYFLGLGSALVRARQFKDALDAFRRAQRLTPLLPEINYLMAFACQNDGQLEQAREYYRRQLSMVPDHLRSLAGAGEVAVEQNRFTDAQKFLRAALARDPDNVQAAYELGLLRFKERRFEEAIPMLERVLALRPDHTESEYYLYLAFSRTRQEGAAARALAQWKKLEALDRKVRSQEVAYEMARAAHREGEAAMSN